MLFHLSLFPTFVLLLSRIRKKAQRAPIKEKCNLSRGHGFKWKEIFKKKKKNKKKKNPVKLSAFDMKNIQKNH